MVYRKTTHTDQYLHYNSQHPASCKESVVSSLFNRAISIFTNKDDLTKENFRKRQVLKENGFHETIISKTFKRVTNNQILSLSQRQMQATGIREEKIKMSINLQYLEGASVKLWTFRIIRTFYLPHPALFLLNCTKTSSDCFVFWLICQ